MSTKGLYAMMMVISTSVGVGILALPIAMSPYAFWVILCSFFVAWIFMTRAAFYVLTVKMQLRGQYSLPGMIRLTLGNSGHRVASVLTLLLLYALLSAYLMTLSAWLKYSMSQLVACPDSVLMGGCIVLFMLMMMFQERALYRMNHMLGWVVIGLFLSMIALKSTPNAYFFEYFQANRTTEWPSMAFLLTIFGFSIIVPGMTEYLAYDQSQAKRAIVLGSLFSLVAYFLWECMAIGHVPLEKLRLLSHAGDNGTGLLVALAAEGGGAHSIIYLGWCFGVLMVTTSFIGVSLSLFHFLSDTLTIHSGLFSRRMGLVLLMYLPPVAIVIGYPKAFLEILRVAGLLVALLLGFFPALMALRYEKTMRARAVAYGVGFFFLCVVVQELLSMIDLMEGL